MFFLCCVLYNFQVSSFKEHSPWHIDPEIIVLLIASDLHRKSFFRFSTFHLKSINRRNKKKYKLHPQLSMKCGGVGSCQWWEEKKSIEKFLKKKLLLLWGKSNDNECLGHGVCNVWILYIFFSTWKLFKVDQLKKKVEHQQKNAFLFHHPYIKTSKVVKEKYRIYLVFFSELWQRDVVMNFVYNSYYRRLHNLIFISFDLIKWTLKGIFHSILLKI